MPLTPKAKHAQTIAQQAAKRADKTWPWFPSRVTPSELRSLAEEYIALFDDYEDRYRRAKVEALNEVIQELNDYLDNQVSAYQVEECIELTERVRLRYLKEGGG